MIVVLTTLIALPGPVASDQPENFFDGLALYDAGDIAETIRIWSDLAKAGDAQAQVGLASLYLAGNGIARDPTRAAELYRQAAEQGDSNGQLNLGRLYFDGIGVKKNMAAAYGWLSLAALQGRRWAEEKRREIQPTLTAGQRAEAQVLMDTLTLPK